MIRMDYIITVQGKEAPVLCLCSTDRKIMLPLRLRREQRLLLEKAQSNEEVRSSLREEMGADRVDRIEIGR